MAHLDEHKLLSDRQHALRKKHSCETQLITVIDDWAKILDKGGQVDTFILDSEKPVNHNNWSKNIFPMLCLYEHQLFASN